MAKKDVETIELERESITEENPKLVIPVGRGGAGKSVVVRYLAEQAVRMGRPCVIADGDRTNATLLSFFKGLSGSTSERPEDHGITRPPSSDSIDVQDWITGLLERMIVSRFSVFLDLGGGDQVLKEYARDLELVSFCAGQGVDPVAIHLLGPNIDDLSYLDTVERSGVFAPEKTILALNLGKVPHGMSPVRAFDAIQSHRTFLSALERGAKAIVMPRLGCMTEIEARRLLFEDAIMSRVAAGQDPIGPVKRQLVTNWMRDMKAAFGPVSHWLP